MIQLITAIRSFLLSNEGYDNVQYISVGMYKLHRRKSNEQIPIDTRVSGIFINPFHKFNLMFYDLVLVLSFHTLSKREFTGKKTP